MWLGKAQIGPILEISLVHPHTIVSMLVNDLADIDNEVFLFLDDYHLVTDPAIRRAVSFLRRHAPSHLHLVLTTRGATAIAWRIDREEPVARGRCLCLAL
jgi:LuxR family maltose regulon positive regulatory protein